MVRVITALITAIAVAIPALWAWRQSAARKRVEKDLQNAKKDIRKAIASKDADKIRRELARWL